MWNQKKSAKVIKNREQKGDYKGFVGIGGRTDVIKWYKLAVRSK